MMVWLEININAFHQQPYNKMHHVLDMKNMFFFNRSAIAHLLHSGLYPNEKFFTFNHFMIKYINNLKKLINNRKFLLNKHLLIIQNPVKHLRWYIL